MSRIHLSGLIPVANVRTNFDMHLPEFLLPINNGLNAIQKSVFECAMVGCNTIWIIANDDVAPILRHCVGDWVYDPVYYSKRGGFSSEQRKEIPIYYVPIHPKDRDRRDSYGWSVLFGAHSAWKTSYKISQWLTPEKYYVSFPMSAYDIYDLRQYRKQINKKGTNFFLYFEDQSIKDNKQLAFTFTGEDFKQCRRQINKITTREYLPPLPDQQYPTQKLPLEERWSARHFELRQVFEKVSEKNANRVDLSWYYDISSWSGYSDFIGSNFDINTPLNYLTKSHKHVKIPYDSEG